MNDDFDEDSNSNSNSNEQDLLDLEANEDNKGLIELEEVGGTPDELSDEKVEFIDTQA